ncbi:hypothetical protein [Streptomyces calvus]
MRHELAHLLLGHAGDNTSIVESLLGALPEGVAPSAVVTALGRTSYGTEAEYDAEMAASCLGELFEELAHSGRDTGRSGAMSRLDDALAHPRRNRRA